MIISILEKKNSMKKVEWNHHQIILLNPPAPKNESREKKQREREMTKENEESAKHQKMESVLIGCQYPRTNKMQKMEKVKHYWTSFRKERSSLTGSKN